MEGDQQEREDRIMSPLLKVRCRSCNRLACEAAPGSLVRVKCGRCGRMFDFVA